MKYQEIIITKRWIPILQEYDRTRAKVVPRQFKFVKDLCAAHHVSNKKLSRYYRKWIDGGKKPESLLPNLVSRAPKRSYRKIPSTSLEFTKILQI